MRKPSINTQTTISIRSITVAAVLFVLAATAARADEAAMTGAGVSPCAFFGQQFKENPQMRALEYIGWAQGFMSGLNTQMMQTDGRSRNLSANSGYQGAAAFLQDYCDAHPLRAFEEGVTIYYNSLPFNTPVQRKK